jgi:hypothetical protein
VTLRPLLDASELRRCMPATAEFLSAVHNEVGKAVGVPAAVRAGIALREALDVDDYELVRALFRELRSRGTWPAHAVENGWQLGAAESEIAAFAARHRARLQAGRTE